ncbi:hypothetical protein V2J09_011815 [Rumex salicifolius]
MSSKLTIFIFFLLASSIISFAARPEPIQPKNKHKGVEIEDFNDESCDGLDKDECLMRRTLVAHLDYIYTQSHNKP